MPNPFATCVRLSLCVLALLAALAGPVLAQAVDGQETAGQGAYRLGPADQLGLRVVVWDIGTLTFAELEAISGTYKIGTDGRMMLPIVGPVEAAGVTATDLAAQISEALQESTGFAEAPSVAIQIEEYRPLFVLGDVARPGEYPYRPGIRAMQALALAGGYYRLAEERGSGLVREGIRIAGTMRENRVDLSAAKIREARLRAEAEGATDFALPGGLTHPEGGSAIEQIYARELALMKTRAEALARSLASLESTRELLETEVELVTSKSEGIDEQITLMNEVVGNLEALMERGLARTPNLINMQRALFDLESRQLDTQNQGFRARQSLGDVERQLNDVLERRATEILTELQDLQAEIARLDVRDETQQRMLVETQAEVALLSEEEEDTVELIPVFRISRETDAGFETAIVAPDTVLQPLDVLDVRWTDPADLPAGEDSAALPGN